MGHHSRSLRAATRTPSPKAKVPKPDALPGSAFPDQSIWDQFTRIGGGLTPVAVSNIIRDADAGDPRRLIDLANESRQKDGHLQSVLFTREAALAGLDWEVVIQGDSRTKGSSKRAPRGERERKFVESVLRGLDAPREDKDAVGFRELIQHLTGGAFYGHAVGETLPTVNARGQIVPRGFALHAARRFGFSRSRGELVFHGDGADSFKDVDFRAEHPFRFIVSQPRITGDVQVREGLMRVLVWCALFRSWTIADWLKLAELAWKPWRLGKYKPGTSKEDIKHLENILRLLSSNGAATHSEDVTIDLKFPEGKSTGASNHPELYARMSAEMSKAVLGQTLTTEQGSVGSNALGNVQDRVRRDVREFDAKHVAAVITRDIVRPLIELNYGPSAPVPIFRFVTDETAAFESTAKGLAVLRKTGMRIPATWAHAQLGVPMPGPDEELLGADVPDNDATDPAPAGDEAEDEAA